MMDTAIRPQVLAFILNWNGLQQTTRCISSLLCSGYSNLKILVLDNGSDEDEAALLKETFGDAIQIVRNASNLGFCQGNNYCLELTRERLRPDYILLFNNDAVATPGFLDALVKRAETDKLIAAVSPSILDNSGRTWFGPSRISWWTGRIIRVRETASACETQFITGCTVLLRYSVLERIGLFDPTFIAYFEDADWSVRAIREGCKLLYEPASLVHHDVDRQSRLGYRYHNQLLARNRIYFMRKHAPALRKPVFYFFQVVLKGIASLPYSLARLRNLDFARAYLRGVREGLSLSLDIPKYGSEE